MPPVAKRPAISYRPIRIGSAGFEETRRTTRPSIDPRRYRIAGAFAILGWMLASSASAQETGARTLYQRAVEAFQAEQYARAAPLFEAAYELDPNPILIFNVARSYDLAGEPTRAIEAFERYLVAAPGASDRAEVEARIAELRRATELAVHEAESAPVDEALSTPREVGPPSDGSAGVRDAAIGTGVAGALLAVTGAILLAPAVLAADTARDPATTMRASIDAAREAESFGAAAVALMATGGAAAVVSIIVGLTTAGSGRPNVSVGPGTLWLSGEF